MRKSFLFAVCSALVLQYTSVLSELPPHYWLHYTQKPFVFRTLIPIIGGSPVGILVVTTLFGLGLALLMLHLYERHWKQTLWNDGVFVVLFTIITLILTRYSNYYDFASAFFFLALFLLWMKEKYALFSVVFLLATLNRETTILLIPILFIAKRNWYILPTIILYAVTRYFLANVFDDFVGQAMYFRLKDNLILHAVNFWTTLFMLVAFSFTGLMFLKKSLDIPRAFAVFVVVGVPMFVVVYLVVGYMFEIRVFAEVLPLLFMSAFLRS